MNNSQPVPTVAVPAAKLPAKMKLRIHIYPDARSTTRMKYCSAWARRYGRTDRAS